MVRFLKAVFIATANRVAASAAVVSAFFAAIRKRLFPSMPPRHSLHCKGLKSDLADPATRSAIEAVEKAFVKDFKWFLRRMPESDIGIEARAEILDSERPTGRFMALHIRSEASCVREEGGYLYHGSKDHLDYWSRHALPVYVIIAGSQDRPIVWQRVERSVCRETESEWSIIVPQTNILDASARLCFEEAISSEPEALMRSIFALDRPLMEEMQDRTTIFVWDEWINPPPTFGNLRIYLGNGRGEEPDMEIGYHLRADSLHEIMTTLFPWASYSYAAPISEYSGTVAVHVIEVEPRPEAYAYIEAESFLEAGYPQEAEPLVPDAEDFMTKAEEEEFWRNRGTSRGPDNPGG